MRKLFALLAFALLVSFASNAQALAVGEAAPEIEFSKTWNGDKTKLSDFKGEYVFLNFWATW